MGGQDTRVRLIGLDTPETRDPRTVVQCFGTEASGRAHAMLDGTSVRLEVDPTQDRADRYGRLLAYAWLPDGRLFNWVMIAEGYGHEYTYEIPYRYQGSFLSAEASARGGDRGLWSPAACNGDTTQTAPPSSPPPSAPANDGGAPYASCAEARAAGAAPLRSGQPGYRPGLDGDGDGVACE